MLDNRTICMFLFTRYYIDYPASDRGRRFTIDRTTGVVSLSNKLDRETEETHSVIILAVDKGKKTCSMIQIFNYIIFRSSS